ncbi:hypothetical protein CTZ24_11930 [Pantoea phytobeneficialis]|uniref:Uncharacterized protein n=1 Tax=Pantoea phytobeneficialis TaxID=2052056 RepID=A0AAP9KPL0_9GAMM|nr:hypothetical protein CTZ24_11930 [Pantoea phytobeneficialis]
MVSPLTLTLSRKREREPIERVSISRKRERQPIERVSISRKRERQPIERIARLPLPHGRSNRSSILHVSLSLMGEGRGEGNLAQRN